MRTARASPEKPCRVCRLLPPSEAELVTGGLLAGWSARSLAKRFASLTRQDVSRHGRICVSEEKEKKCR